MATDFPEREGTQVAVDHFKCSGCGANFVFDPEKQCLVCRHCGLEKGFKSTVNSGETDLLAGFDNAPKWDGESVVYRCANCGAKVVIGKGETATSCPFCGTAQVVATEELPGLKPNGVIPFSISDTKAAESVKKWVGRKWLAPRKLKKTVSPENIKGVYMPGFTFDSATVSTYKGRIGQTHTRVVGSGKNRHTETYIVWQNISGRLDEFFDDVLITAGSKFGQKELNNIEPFDTGRSMGYTQEYLLGFMAYHYERRVEDCWVNAKQKINDEIKRKILSRYVYDKIDFLNVDTEYNRVTYKYVMIPVYVGHYNFKNKIYNFHVNGSTGKTGGEIPSSKLKIALIVLLVLAIVALFAALMIINE